MSSESLLQLLPPPPRERADAARNRKQVLDAADRLFAERGACNVSMDDVAAAAGVGKGTVYRRFKDQSGLALALLEEKERVLQEAIIRGEPPTGPGAPARDRLPAFFSELISLLDAHTELHVLSETAARGARYRSGLYAFYRLHTQILLQEIAPDRDVEVLADQLLAPLQAELFVYLRDERGVTVERIEAELLRLVEQATACGE